MKRIVRQGLPAQRCVSKVETPADGLVFRVCKDHLPRIEQDILILLARAERVGMQHPYSIPYPLFVSNSGDILASCPTEWLVSPGPWQRRGLIRFENLLKAVHHNHMYSQFVADIGCWQSMHVIYLGASCLRWPGLPVFAYSSYDTAVLTVETQIACVEGIVQQLPQWRTAIKRMPVREKTKALELIALRREAVSLLQRLKLVRKSPGRKTRKRS